MLRPKIIHLYGVDRLCHPLLLVLTYAQPNVPQMKDEAMKETEAQVTITELN